MRASSRLSDREDGFASYWAVRGIRITIDDSTGRPWSGAGKKRHDHSAFNNAWFSVGSPVGGTNSARAWHETVLDDGEPSPSVAG